MEGLLAKVLEPFHDGGGQVWLVSDPDRLLAEDSIQLALSERAIDVISYDDPIAFRYDFSSQRKAASTSVVIVVNSDAQALEDLPWDLLQRGHKVRLDAGTLFPEIDTRVLDVLTREDLPLLYRAIARYQPDRMGFTSSQDFVLRHLYKSAPEIIQSQSDLLRLLLRKHYRGVIFPEMLDKRLAKLLCLSFADLAWPLQDCVLRPTAFLAFLQQEWTKFIATLDEPGDGITAINQQWWQERSLLPFDHPDIRVYIDNFFAEGLLTPIDCKHPENFHDTWLLIGLNTDPKQHLALRMEQMQSICRDEMPGEDASHQQWQTYARQWGELRHLAYGNEWGDTVHQSVSELEQLLDQRFTAWMLQRFGSLHNQPGQLPTMVHMVPRFMARRLEQEGTKRIALLVMDGMAYDQWLALKSQLPEGCNVTESASFAWVPTITSVSRQAIFAGKTPRHFAKNIKNPKEESLWKTYWQDQSFNPTAVYYQRAISDGDLEHVLESLGDRRVRAAGLVCNAVDDRMHGALDGLSGLHAQLQHWAKDGFFNKLISGLIELGYEVVITADHGNTEAEGQGRPSEGVLSKERHERARIYTDEILRDDALSKFEGISWPVSFGLPEDYLPILAKGRSAFVKQGEKNVGHGGISIEEVIVPFVHIVSSKQ